MKKQIEILKIILALITGLAILLPLNTIAQEERSQSKAESITKTLPSCLLTNKNEDVLIIDSRPYTYNNKTVFLKKVNDKEHTVSVDQITFPCRARITFEEFSAVDEAHPFKKGQRILTKVYIY